MKQTFKRKAKTILVLTLAAISLVLVCLNFTGCCCCSSFAEGFAEGFEQGYNGYY